MSGNLKLKKIGTVFFCPEITKGTANYDNTTDTLGTTTTAIVSGLGGTDDMFIGLQMYFYSGANSGRVVTVTDYATSTGTLTFSPADGQGAFSAAVAVGEKFLLGAILPASNPSFAPQTRFIDRDEWETDTLEKPSGIAGPNESTWSFDSEVGGLTTTAGDSTTAGADRFSRLLEMIGSFTSGTGTTVDGDWGSTTSGDVDSVSGLSVGDPIMIDNEVAIIQTISSKTLTVAPAFTSAPTDTTVVYAGEVHTPADSGHKSFTICHLKDDQLWAFVGCVGNVKASATFNELLKFSFDGQGGSWSITDSYSDLDGLQDSNKPIAVISARLHFGSTTTWCNSFEWDLGHSVESVEDCHAGVEKIVADRSATAKVTFRNRDNTPLETWQKEKTTGLLVVQAGNSAGNVVVIYGQVQIESVEDAEYNGVLAYSASLKFYDDRGTLTPTKPKIARL